LVGKPVARTVPNPLAAISAYGSAALKAILAADSDLDLARGETARQAGSQISKIFFAGRAPRHLGAVAVMTSGNQSSQFF